MSQNSRILDVLADGRAHTTRVIHERAGFSRLNSRIAELRSRGYVIECFHVPGKTGSDGYGYRLLSERSDRRAGNRPVRSAPLAEQVASGGPHSSLPPAQPPARGAKAFSPHLTVDSLEESDAASAHPEVPSGQLSLSVAA